MPVEIKVLLKNLVLIFSLFIAGYLPVAIGMRAVLITHLFAVLVLSAMVVILGKAISRVLRFPSVPGFQSGAEIVIGFSMLSIFHIAITACFNLYAYQAFYCDLILVAMALFLLIKNCTIASSKCLVSDSWSSTLIDSSVIIVLGFFTALWLRESLVSVLEAKQSGVFRVWNDFILQAVEIGYQLNYPSFNGESPYLADLPITFYHRASYALSAVFGWMTGDSLLSVATYFWLPMGFIMMGVGAYSLGSALGGRVAGVLSGLAIFALPDASMYGLKNGYFAFYWLLAVAPGGGYALGLSFVALAFFWLSIRRPGDFYLVYIGFVITLLAAFFRIHVAIPLIFLYVGLITFSIRLSLLSRVLLVLGLLLTLFCTLLFFEKITFAPHFFTGQQDGIKYIEAVHLAVPTAYEGAFGKVMLQEGTFWRALVGYGLMLVAQHGLLLITPFFGLFAFFRDRKNWPLFAVPLGLIVIHSAITFLFPTPSHGDITEWSHRSFILLHAVLVIFLVACVAQSSVFKKLIFFSARHPTYRNILIIFFIPIALWAPIKFGKNLQYGTLRDGPTACATKVSEDIFNASNFIKERSSAGDIILVTDGDPSALLTSLTGLQAYVSRDALYQKVGGVGKSLSTTRIAEVMSLKNIPDYDSLRNFGYKSNVRWVVVYANDWPLVTEAVMKNAVFHSGQVSVFDLKAN